MVLRHVSILTNHHQGVLKNVQFFYFSTIYMILSFEGGSSRSHYVEESFWTWLWTCRQTEY